MGFEAAFLILEGEVLQFNNSELKKTDLLDDHGPIFFGKMTEQRRKKIKFQNDVKKLSLKFGKYQKNYKQGDFFNQNSLLDAKKKIRENCILTAYCDSIILKLGLEDFEKYFRSVIEKREKVNHGLLKDFFPNLMADKNSIAIFKALNHSMIRRTYKKGEKIINEFDLQNSLYLISNGTVQLTKNLDTVKMAQTVETLKKKISENAKIGNTDKKRIFLLKDLMKQLSMKLNDMEVKKLIQITVLVTGDKLGEGSLHSSKADNTSLFGAEACEKTELYSINARVLAHHLPADYRNKMLDTFETKMRIRLEKFKKESPQILKNFEEKVKKIDYVNVCRTFKMVNKSERSNIVKNFIKSRVVDNKGKFLNLPKSKTVKEKFKQKIVASSRLRQVLRYKKEYDFKKKSKNYMDDLLEKLEFRKVKHKRSRSMETENGIFMAKKNFHKIKLLNSKKISKILL